MEKGKKPRKKNILINAISFFTYEKLLFVMLTFFYFLFTDGDQQNNAISRGSNFIQSHCDINFFYCWFVPSSIL